MEKFGTSPVRYSFWVFTEKVPLMSYKFNRINHQIANKSEQESMTKIYASKPYDTLWGFVYKLHPTTWEYLKLKTYLAGILHLPSKCDITDLELA